MPLKPIPRTRLSEDVATQIGRLIARGDYQPGDRLPGERQLALTLRVNRNSVREGLKKLEMMKVLTIRQGDGIYIRDYSRESSLEFLSLLLLTRDRIDLGVVRGIFHVQEVTGIDMSRLAARRRTSENLGHLEEIISRERAEAHSPALVKEFDFKFSLELSKASKILIYTMMLNSFRGIYDFYMDLFLLEEGIDAYLWDYHETLFKAVRSKDEEQAASLMSVAIRYGRERVLNRLAEEKE